MCLVTVLDIFSSCIKIREYFIQVTSHLAVDCAQMLMEIVKIYLSFVNCYDLRKTLAGAYQYLLHTGNALRIPGSRILGSITCIFHASKFAPALYMLYNSLSYAICEKQ